MFDTSDFVLSLFDFVGCYNPFNRFRVLFRCQLEVHEYANGYRLSRSCKNKSQAKITNEIRPGRYKTCLLRTIPRNEHA